MTDPKDPLGIIGVTVADKYKILEVAGEGGFSAVYKAEHLIWRQPVALKFFHILEDAEPDLREQLLNDFIQEGRLMSELSSKSAAIVQARDIGKLDMADGAWIPYMVLEWLDGTPLDIALAREKQAGAAPRSVAEAISLLEPCAVALDVAHKQKIAHRDLKPANIMIMGDGRAEDATVKVLDFGIAKVMADHSQLQQQLQMTGHQITAFTPNHGAPEQFSRNYGATGPWTDVFAMALILVELLRGGDRALDGKAFFELGVSSCDPNKRPTPNSFGLNVTPGIEAVFAKALSVHPKDRYATMGEFWAELHRQVFPDAETWRSVRTTGQMPALSTATPSMPAPTASNPMGYVAGPPTGNGIATASLAPPPSSPKTGLLIAVVLGLIAIVGIAAAVVLLRSEESAPVATEDDGSKATATASATMGLVPPREGPCPAGMNVVAGGSYMMGSNDKGFPLWKPAHKVTIDSFCLNTTEVTVAAYKKCVEADKCKPADTKPEYPKAANDSVEDHEKQLEAFGEFCNWDRPKRDNHPINCVDWYRADAYCQALEQRLPTEAEWELAARGTDGRKFPWGDDSGDQTYMNAAGTEWRAWLADKGFPAPASLMYEADDGFTGTAPVGTFPRAMTQQKLVDMVGNVWEWTADYYALYKDEAQVNPKGPAAGDRKAIRGGGFNGEVSLWVNPAARYHQLAKASVHAVGFRCAASVTEAQ